MAEEIIPETNVSAILSNLPENIRSQILIIIQQGTYNLKIELVNAITDGSEHRRQIQKLFLSYRDVLSDFGLKPEAGKDQS